MKCAKNNNKDLTPENPGEIVSEPSKASWGSSHIGDIYKNWPKVNDKPEDAAFLKHCSSVDMDDDLLINMLNAYGIPSFKNYPSNGGLGKVVLGMSGDGADIFVPKSMLEDAMALLGGSNDD
ncbi:MAG: hypothetical protein RR372_00930 [Oscillospiraceae bacterium]